MAILVVGEATGMTAEEDAAAAHQLYPEGSLPAGFRIRMAGPMDGGWRIVTLWDSAADWERFGAAWLPPAGGAAGGAPPPPVQIGPVDTVLTVWEL